MVAPTIYRSDDPSAPSLTGEVNSLIGLLDAILVNGYGAKAAAGWTKLFSGTNKAVYQQAGGNLRCLQVVDDGTGSAAYARVRAYESMTDVDTGVGPAPTEAEISGGGYCHKSQSASTTVRPWIAFATARSFILFTYPQGANASLPSSSTTYIHLLGLADVESKLETPDDFATLAIVSPNSLYNSAFNFAIDVDAAFTAHPHLFMLRPYTQLEGAEKMAFRARSYSGFTQSGFGSVPYPDPVTGKLLMSKVDLSEAGSVLLPRAEFPGVWATPHDDSDFGDLDTFSGYGTLAGKDFIIVKSTGIAVGSVFIIETNGGWL